MSTVHGLAGPAWGFGRAHSGALPLVPCDPDNSAAYNLESFGERRYRLTLAVPGFSYREIEVVADGGFLRVSGKTRKAQASGDSLHQGLSSTLRHTFLLLQPLSVVATDARDGLLRIDLENDAVAPGLALKRPIVWETAGALGLAA
jgi:HSP20 family molecular chaperone IbpA